MSRHRDEPPPLPRLFAQPEGSFVCRRPHAGRSVVPVLTFLILFVVLLLFVSRYYLFPALEAARGASEPQKRVLSASASLILALVLFVLLAMLLLIFRIGRFFRPADRTPVKPTRYVDAWEESGRRMKTPEKEE